MRDERMARERKRLADCADCGDCADCLARVAGAAGISTGADAAGGDGDSDERAVIDAYGNSYTAAIHAYSDGTTAHFDGDGNCYRYGDRKRNRPTPPDADPVADFDAYAERMARRHGWGDATWHWAVMVSRDVPTG